MAESLAHYRYYDIPIEDAMPRTFVAVEVKLRAVLDLGQGSIRQRLRMSYERMLAVDWRKDMRRGRESMTQKLGRAVCEIGLEGMLVPSAAQPHDFNLLVFPANLRPASSMRVLNVDRLPG
jgi:RES domain-containing protein